MSLSVAAWIWIMAFWLLVMALIMDKITGWLRTGKGNKHKIQIKQMILMYYMYYEKLI